MRMNSRLHQRARLVYSLPNEDSFLTGQTKPAPRIHGELLKLGIDVGQTSVAKYMAVAEHDLRKVENVSA